MTQQSWEPARAAPLGSIWRNARLTGIGEKELGNLVDPVQLVGTETLAAGKIQPEAEGFCLSYIQWPA